MYASNYFEQKILNTAKGATLAAPSTVYVSLYLSNPGDENGGTEVSYDGYKRQAISFAAPVSQSGGIRAIRNSAQVTFPVAANDVGTATHIAIMDAQTGGNMLCYSPIADPLLIKANTEPTLLAESVEFSISGDLSDYFKQKILNVLRGESIPGFTPHMALFNGHPENGGSELSGENYGRVSVTMGSVSQESSGRAVLKNSAAASFEDPSGNWGSWTHTAVFDSSAEGNPIWVQALSSPWTLKAGYKPVIKAGALELAVN